MRLFVSNTLMFLLILLMLIQPVQARAYSQSMDTALVCMNATQKIEKKYNIKEHLLTTISSVESGRWNQKYQQTTAWPWTVNAQGKGYYFKTKAEAVRKVKSLQHAGIRSIDVGCMQINLAYHGKAFKSVEEAFDPQKNVEYSAKFLRKLYKRKGNDWVKAATAYHSNAPHKARRYKRKLVTAYVKVKQAMNNNALNLTNMGQKQTKKLATNRIYDKNKTLIEQTTAKKANAWREAKLEEYRQSKRL